MGADPAPWRSAAALVFVADVAAPDPGDDEAHHLRRVLRLRPGATVCASDGVGGVVACRLRADGGLDAEGAPLRVPPPEPGDEVVVGFAPPKGERTDLVVSKLTELGVDRILVLRAERSVVRWDGERAERALARLERLARSAAAQSRRPLLPVVAVADLDGLVADGVPAADLEGRAPVATDRRLLVGPEGGWSEAEREACDRHGGRVVLGRQVLRAETAAIAAAVVLTGARDGLLRS